MSSSAIDKLYREKVIKKAGGGMMNIDEMTRPLGYAAGGPIPPEPEKTGMIKKIKDLFKYENESGTRSLLMDFIRSEGMFAPSGKKFDTSDSLQQREDGGEEYMKIFNFLWKQGFDSQQIDDIINRRVNQEDLVPSHDGSGEFKG